MLSKTYFSPGYNEVCTGKPGTKEKGYGNNREGLLKKDKQVAFLLCLEPEEVICISKDVTERRSVLNRRSCSVCAVSPIMEFYG